MSTEILTDVAEYYASKLAEHGETARGVDWNGEESQALRFAQLALIIDDREAFSINDLGCGYGALYDYLRTKYSRFSYSGCDIAADMVKAAAGRYPAGGNAEFYITDEPPEVADFGIASGIFNVRLSRTDTEWHEYILSTLEVLDKTSRQGFAFNCLTKYSDEDRKRAYLFYADPCALFDYCKRSFSRNVALLHDYDLYEFTILVRK